MTLESTNNINRYIGNSSTKSFAFTFKVWKKSEVLVLVGDGETESVAASTSYSVSLSSSGGTVTFRTAPKTGQKIVIKRNMPYLQEDDYRNGTRFDAEEVEDRLDQDCAERQDLRLELSRAVKVPYTSDVSADELVAQLMAAVQMMREAGDISGASLVKATGTETYRTLADRFADVINVKDYGAKGDNLTDDRAAIQAALDENDCGRVVFPYGVYLISDTIEIRSAEPCNGKTVDLCGSRLVWIGPEDGVMIKVYDRCRIINGRVSGASTDYHEHVAGTCIRFMPQSAGYGSNLEVDQFNISGIDCGEYRDTGTVYNGISSTKLLDVYVHAGIYGAGGAMSGEGGATGIRLIGDDNKIIQASIQQCRYGFEMVGTGNKIDGCYFYTILPEEQDVIVPGSAAIHYAYSDRVAGDQIIGANTFSSCYFDYPNYVIYNDKTHQVTTSIVGSFVLGFPQPGDGATHFNVYMMGNKASPLCVSNFVNVLGQHVNFYGAKACIEFNHRDVGEITEHYARHNRSMGANAYITPCQAEFQVENGEVVSVANDLNASAGDYYFIGGILCSSSGNIPSFDVYVGNDSSSTLTQLQLHCVSTQDGLEFSLDSTATPNISWWGIAVGAAKTVTIQGHDKIFLPVYVHFYGSATVMNLYAKLDIHGLDGVGFLKQRANSLAFTSSSYLYDAGSAQGKHGVVPFYGYTTDYSVSDFDSLETSGTWQIGWTADTDHSPYARETGVTVGFIEILRHRPHGDVSSGFGAMQRVTVLNGEPGTVYVRRTLGADNWSEWVALSST